MDGAGRADGSLSLTRRAAVVALAASLGVAGPSRGAEPHWARLGELLRQARLVVAGTVTRSEPFEDGRLVVAHVLPDRTLKGDAGMGEVAVVEEHDLPSSPTLLPTGRHVVAFLVRAPRTSSLARALPAGPTYWALVQGRMGAIASPSAESVREAADVVARWAALATDASADATTRTATQRALAFDELAAVHPVVVEDGIALVRSLPGLAGSLDAGERQRLERTLARRDLPARLRVALVDTIAAQRLVELLPALRALKDPPAPVLAAIWAAERALGSAPTAASLLRFLASRDPSIRTVAAPALLATGDPNAASRVERMARTDSDLEVRKAATDALGRVKAPGGLAALERLYATSPDVRSNAGNAIVAWGGDDAADALARLVFAAPQDGQQWAVSLLFALGRTRDDPRIVRIRTTHPDPAVRSLVEHGYDLGTEHH